MGRANPFRVLPVSRWCFATKRLGVLAVFRRQSINDQEFRWLRMFADQAASAIANARAFSELDRLRQQLEFHNAYLKEEVERHSLLAASWDGAGGAPGARTGGRCRTY